MFKSVTSWLDETASRLPNKIAFATEIKGETVSLTFNELRETAKRIAVKLLVNGFGKKPVLLVMDKTPSFVAAMLGCAYANCPYAPIDESNPPERIQKIVETLKPCVCITKPEYIESIGDCVNIWLFDSVIDDKYENAEYLLLQAYKNRISSDLLYIIFTSGSTGTPKGVAVSHSNMIDYTLALSETFGFGEETVFGQSVPFFFDSSILYIYQTIKNGCTDWLIPKTTLMFAAKTIDFLNTHQCNTIYWVPTSYNIIAKSGIFDKRIPEYLTNCFFVGEVMPNSVLNVWRRALPNARFVNLFGPTEITGTFIYDLSRTIIMKFIFLSQQCSHNINIYMIE
jgi:non-ribosomal peptide synthetase component F